MGIGDCGIIRVIRVRIRVRKEVPLEAIPEELKRRREECGLSLEDLSEDTNIAVRFLKAIEEGNFDVLPRPYIRMFLKAYGNRVGMDAESVLRRFDEAVGPEEHVRKRVGQPVVRSVFPTRRLAIAGVVLVVVAGIYGLIKWGTGEHGVSEAPPSTDKDVRELEASREISLERASIRDTVASEQSVKGEVAEIVREELTLKEETFAPSAELSEELEKPMAVDSILVLEGEAREEVWLSVQADGGPEDYWTMKAEDQRTWVAKDSFEVTLGKPQGMAFRFRGKAVVDTAWHREPIHLMFSREGVEIVKKIRRPAVTPVPVDSVGEGNEG